MSRATPGERQYLVEVQGSEDGVHHWADVLIMEPRNVFRWEGTPESAAQAVLASWLELEAEQERERKPFVRAVVWDWGQPDDAEVDAAAAIAGPGWVVGAGPHIEARAAGCARLAGPRKVT